jgi:hypothetical protein
MTTTRKTFIGSLALAALLLTAGAALADHFVGTWKVKDSAGKDFQIVIAKDGTASGEHAGKPMKGKWAEKDDAVTVTWDTGWTTKIAKTGSGYTKTATEGGSEKGSASAAEKVK